MPELLTRRRADLEAQLESLSLELNHWEQLTNQRLLEKHHSQVVALARQMRALNDRVRQTWNGADDFLAIRKAQRDCAAVHGVWNYFREKLLMRFDEHIGDYLRAADAYVWACYEPVLTERREANQGEAFREPPLVTFDVETSPWARSRGTAAADDLPTQTSSAFDQTMAAMPIALMGIPWSAIVLLPSLAALAHETGHIVESDFALGMPLENAIAAATSKSSISDGWSHHWRKEVFADLFACYAAGPSFVWTLADSIVDPPDAVKERRRPSNGQWGKYPPATLRILLNLAALRLLGHSDEAAAIEQYWKADYPAHAMEDFVGDVGPVTEAVYRAATLPKTLDYARLARNVNEYDRVYRTAVLQNSDLSAGELYDPRTLVAVASAVSRKPPKDVDQRLLWTRLQQHIVESRPPGVLEEQQERAKDERSVRMQTDRLAGVLFRDVVGEYDDL